MRKLTHRAKAPVKKREKILFYDFQSGELKLENRVSYTVFFQYWQKNKKVDILHRGFSPVIKESTKKPGFSH